LARKSAEIARSFAASSGSDLVTSNMDDRSETRLLREFQNGNYLNYPTVKGRLVRSGNRYLRWENDPLDRFVILLSPLAAVPTAQGSARSCHL
jgi:hypothetical protein